jgi:uncharacterized protein YggE
MRIDWKVVAAFGVGIGLALVLIGPLGRQALGVRPAVAQGGEDGKPVHIISTQGTATVRVKPDSARIFFRVTKAAQTPAEVRAATVKATNDVMSDLQGLGIEKLFTKTSTTNVEIVWDSNNKLRITGYRMTTEFTVRVVDTDMERLGESAGTVVDTALEDDQEDRLKCLQDAVADARKNADAMAETAGVTIRGPVTINGESSRPEYFASNSAMVQSMSPAGGEGTASSYAAGEIEITCSTRCTFEFEGA